MASQRSYIPPQIQHQMTQALERSLPANLRQYASGNTYVPQHAQQAILQHIEKNMPAHLREYAGEFVRQQALSGAATYHPTNPAPMQRAAPSMVNPMRRDHSLGFGQQYTVDIDNPASQTQGGLSYAAQYQQQGDNHTGAGSAGAPDGSPSGPNYDFIVNADHRSTTNWLLQASLKTRIAVVGGGFVVLLLLTWIFIALLTAGSAASVQNLTALAQEQVELARISEAPARDARTEQTLNLASTTRLSLLSDEAAIATYLGSVGSPPSSDTLTKDRSSAIDAELQTAKTNGTYDQTYNTIVAEQLGRYASNLKKAFDATSNPRERTLINEAYANAQLLIALSQSR